MKKYIFFLSIFLIIYFLTAVYNNADWDLWAKLAVGKIFFTTGSVLKHDIFAYTPTKSLWIDHEWLSGVIFYYLAEKFGDSGLCMLRIFLMLSVFLCVFKLNQIKFPEQNNYRIIYYAFFLYALVFSFVSTVQAHCFTFAFFALWMYVLERIKRNENRLIWIFPATMMIWSNLHGGFIAGLGFVFLYAIGEAFNRRSFAKYFLIFFISILVTLINPYGIKYWPYLINAVFMSRPFLTEWMPLDLFGPFNIAFGFKIFVIFTLFSMPYIFIKKLKEISWAEIFVLVLTFWISLQHIMHTTFFLIAATGYITNYFYQAFDFYTLNIIKKYYSVFSPKIKIICGFFKEFVIYGLIILVGALTINFVPLKVKVDNTIFPVKAVKFIQQNHLSGNLLVLFNWGSYALWKLYPQCLVAVDGRYDGVYADSIINETARFHYVGNNWNELMTKYHADIILANTDYEVYKTLIKLDEWRVIYKDKISAVFIPVSKNKNHWIIPDEKINLDNEKFKTRILN